MPEPASRVTQLLKGLSSEPPNASGVADDLLPLVYDELRRMAGGLFAHEPRAGAGQTLQATALVHEAYLRLVGSGDVDWNGRAHFFAAAGRAMRRILVERARARSREKRGGAMARVDAELDQLGHELDPTSVLAIDEAMSKLEARDAELARLVTFKCFAGLTWEEIGKALGSTVGAVRSRWEFARAWLVRELGRDAAAQPDA